MKKTVSIIISIFLIVCSVTMFSGCTGPDDSSVFEPLALSIVMGVHKHFPKPVFTSENVQEPIYEACYSYGDISVFTVEGMPKPHCDYDITEPDKSITDTKRKQLARQNTNSIIYECSRAAATSEETDTLAALILAANSLQASSASDKEMLVYDSGLCTTGLLSQASNDVLSADPELVAEKLGNTHSLPDLSGVTVKWIGLGAVSGEQSEIPDSYKYKLKKLWTAIILASGGEVDFDTSPVYGEEAEGLPDVSTVSFVQDSLDIDFSDTAAVKEPVRFDESSIKFVADSAEFINPVVAREALMPIAEILADNPTFNIIVAGTTASVGDGYTLSFKRAQACKDILVSMGADGGNIECIGLGSSDNCFHVDDLDSNGELIEEYAKLNRAIYIFAADSDAARNIKSA